MIKIIVLCVVFYACIYISSYFIMSIKQRIQLLAYFYEDVSMFYQLAIYQERDVMYIFEKLRIKSQGIYHIFGYIYDCMIQNPSDDVERLWDIQVRALDEICENDRNIMCEFGTIFTCLRSLKAKQDFERYIKALDIYIAQQTKDMKKTIMLYRKFGIVAGLFFVIVLL